MNKRTGFARNLRKQSKEAEKLLWKNLRAKQLEGFKFRRQQPIGNYIVDFVCFEKGLVVELDGGQHAVEKEKDMMRDQWLSAESFRVLRFWNTEVLIISFFLRFHRLPSNLLHAVARMANLAIVSSPLLHP